MNAKHADHDLERSVLGTLILTPGRIHQAKDTIEAGDFHDPLHARLFEIIESIATAADAGEIPADLVARRLAETEDGDHSGTVTTLIQHSVPGRHLQHRLLEVRRLSRRRELMRIAADLQSAAANDMESEIDDLADTATGALSQVLDEGDIEPPVSGDDAVAGAVDDIMLRARGEGPSLLKTGFDELDAKLVGLFPGNLIIIGARPGVGKTSIALNIAANAANAGAGVLFISLEMSARELAMRQLAVRANIPMHVLRAERPDITPGQTERLKAAADSSGISGVQLQCPGGLTPEGLRGRVARASQDGDLDLVIVDYMQLMRLSVRRADTTEWMELTEISRSIKETAREFGLPVLALAQLNREQSKRKNESAAPQLTDLRGSGSLEQDADVVLMLHRPKEHSDDYELFIRKHRNGPVGKIDLGFDGATTSFGPPKQTDQIDWEPM